MVAVVRDRPETVRLLAQRGVPACVAGEVVPGSGSAHLVGEHPRN